MSLGDLLHAGLSALMAHKFRSLLTLLGVTLGALLLFCSISGGLGVIDAVNQRLSAGDRLLEIIVTTGVQTDEVTPEQARQAGFIEEMSDERRVRLARASGVGGVRPVNMNLEASESLASIDHVIAAWSRLRFSSTVHLQKSDQWCSAVMNAIPPKNTDFSTVLVAVQNGQSNVAGRDGVLVSELFLYRQGHRTEAEVAAIVGTKIQVTSRNPKLENDQVKPGDPQRREAIQSLSFRSEPMQIAGVYRYPNEEEIREEPELNQMLGVDVMIRYDKATACWRGLGLSANRTGAVVLADEPENVGQIEAEISEMGFRTRSLAELAMQIRTGVLLITLLITSIAATALVISAIGITNTMVMNVLERRKDIAVMKAIGARDRDLKRMFLMEGFLMGLAGGLSGLALGLLLSRLGGDIIRQQLEEKLNEPLYGDVFAYPIWLIIATPLVAATITMLASYLPARRAARIDPAEVLRGL